MTQTVSIKLPSQTVYVSGTVNGVDKVFTRNGEFWQAEADKADNNVYQVSVTAVDSLGRSTSFQTTVFSGLNLITDRTAQDVASGTEKGFYNYTDLNRVQAAVATVAQMLTEAGQQTDIPAQTNWALGEIPTHTQMMKYLVDVIFIANQLALPMTLWPALPEDMDYLNYKGANAIEQLLEDVVNFLGLMEQQSIHSGTFYAGEVW